MVLKILTWAFFLDSISGLLWKNDPLSCLKAGPLFSQKLQYATGHLKRKEKTWCVFKPLKINKFIMQKNKSVLVRQKIYRLFKNILREILGHYLAAYSHSFVWVPFTLSEFQGSRGPAHVNAAAGLGLSDGEFVFIPTGVQHSPTMSEENYTGKT